MVIAEHSRVCIKRSLLPLSKSDCLILIDINNNTCRNTCMIAKVWVKQKYGGKVSSRCPPDAHVQVWKHGNDKIYLNCRYSVDQVSSTILDCKIEVQNSQSRYLVKYANYRIFYFWYNFFSTNKKKKCVVDLPIWYILKQI